MLSFKYRAKRSDFLNKHGIVILAHFTLSVVICRNFIFDNFPAGVDMLGWISRTNFLSENLRWIYLWSPQSFGTIRQHTFETIVAAANTFISNPLLTLKLLIFFIIFITGVSMYFFTYRYTMHRIGSFFASFAYVMGQAFVGQLISAHLDTSMFYALLPLGLIFFEKTVAEYKLKNIIYFSIFLAFVVFFVRIDFLVYFIITLGIYIIVMLFFESEKMNLIYKIAKIFIIVGVFFLFIGAFQIVPNILSVTPSWINPNFRFYIEDILQRIVNFHASFLGYAGERSYLHFIGGIGPTSHPFLSLTQYRLAMTVLPILAFSAILLRRDKITFFSIILAIVSIIFVAGPQPPFGDMFLWAYNNVPFFGAFRATNRFLMITYFAYALLSGITVQVMFDKFKTMQGSANKRIFKGIPYLFVMLLMVSTSLGSSFVITHGLLTYEPPDDEVLPYKWIKSQPGDFRVATLPWEELAMEMEYKGKKEPYMANSWVEHDYGSESSLFHGKTVTSSGGTWNPYTLAFMSNTKYWINDLATDNFAKMLGAFNVKYIVVRPNAVSRRTTSTGKDSLNFFLQQKGLKPVFIYKNTTIYENEYFTQKMFSVQKYAIVVGERDAFVSLSTLENFNLNETALYFANQLIQEYGFEKFSQFLNGTNAIIFVNSEPFDLALQTAGDAIRIRAANYAYPSLNDKKYWIARNLKEEKLALDPTGTHLFRKTALSTSGEVITSIPLEIKKKADYEIWLKIACRSDAARLRVAIDKFKIGEVIPHSIFDSEFKWVKIGSMNLNAGNHEIFLENIFSEYGRRNDVEEILLIEPDKFEKYNDIVASLIQKNYKKTIILYEGEQIFKWANTSKNFGISNFPYGASQGKNLFNGDKESHIKFTAPILESGEYAIGLRGINLNIDFNKSISSVNFYSNKWHDSKFFAYREGFKNWKNLNPDKSTVSAQDDKLEIDLREGGRKYFTLARKVYNPPLDWSDIGSFSLSFKGANTRKYFSLFVYDVDSNFAKYDFLDSSTEWQNYIFLKSLPKEYSGNIDWRRISSVEITSESKDNLGKFYLKIEGFGSEESYPSWKIFSIGRLTAGDINIELNISGDENIFLDQILLYPVGYYNVQEKMLNINASKTEVSYKMLNPTEYVAHINTGEPFLLVFSEAYDPSWKAYIGGKKIDSVVAYSFINSFPIDKTGEFDVVIEFTGQKYGFIGILISITSLFLALLYLRNPIAFGRFASIKENYSLLNVSPIKNSIYRVKILNLYILKEKFLEYLPIIFIISISIITTRSFIFSSEYPAGIDFLGVISRASYIAKNSEALSIWNTQYFGFVVNFSLDTLLGLINTEINNPVLVVKLFTFLIYLTAGTSVYIFFRSHGGSIAVSLFVVYVYTMNQFFTSQVASGHLSIALFYSLLPISLLLFQRAIELDNFKNIFTLSFFLTITTFFTRIDLIIFYISLLSIYTVIFIIYETKKLIASKKVFKVIILSAFFFLLFGAFQLLPNISGTDPAFLNQNFKFPIEDVMERSLGLYQSFIGFGAELSYLAFIYDLTWSSHPPFLTITKYYLAMSILPLLAFLTLFLRRDKNIIFFMILAIVSVIVASGPYPPFGDIFIWAYNNIPFFGGIRATNRWLMLTYFAYAFLSGVLVQVLFKKLKALEVKHDNLLINNVPKVAPYLFILLIMSSVSVGSYFVITDGLLTYDPPDYEVLPYKWIKEQAGDFRVATVPWDEKYYLLKYKGNEWVEHDFGFESSMFHGKPVFVSGGTYTFLPYTLSLVGNTRSWVDNYATDNITEVLGIANVKYIVVRPQSTSWVTEYTGKASIDFFPKQKGMKPVFAYKNTTVYENEYFTPKIFPVQKYAIVVGETDAIVSPSILENFNLNETALYFADQLIEEYGFEKFSQLLNGADALIFVNSEPFDLVMLGAKDRIKATKYAYPSLNDTKYWIAKDYGGHRVLGTRGDFVNVSIPLAVSKKGIYDIWLRTLIGQNKGTMKIIVDSKLVGEITPFAKYQSGLKWVKVGSIELNNGKHTIAIENTHSVHGFHNELDEILMADSQDLEIANKTLEMMKQNSGKIIQIIEGEQVFKLSNASKNLIVNDLSLKAGNGLVLMPVDICGSGKNNASMELYVPRTDEYVIGVRTINQSNLKFIISREASDQYRLELTPNISEPSECIEGIGMDKTTTWKNLNQDNVILSDEKENGLKIEAAISNRQYYGLIENKFEPLADWSNKTRIPLWFKGNNTGGSFMYIVNFNYSYNNWARFGFTDESNEWERIVFLKSNPDAVEGTIDWSKVWSIQISLEDKNLTGTFYIDRLNRNYENATLTWIFSDPIKFKRGQNKFNLIINGNSPIDQILINPLENERGSIKRATPRVSFDRISSTKYLAHVKTDVPFLLIFSEAYHPLWKAYLDGKEIDSIVAYSFINSFPINETGEFDVVIEFTGQKYAFYGGIISLLSFIFALGYLFYDGKKAEDSIRRRK